MSVPKRLFPHEKRTLLKHWTAENCQLCRFHAILYRLTLMFSPFY